MILISLALFYVGCGALHAAFFPIGDVEECVAAPALGVCSNPYVPFQCSSCLLTRNFNSVTSC